jgi:hypothetical protein
MIHSVLVTGKAGRKHIDNAYNCNVSEHTYLIHSPSYDPLPFPNPEDMKGRPMLMRTT